MWQLMSLAMAKLSKPRGGKPLRTPANGFPGFVSRRRLERIVTGDIWGFMRHFVEDLQIAKDKKRQASAYVEQASDFYIAAQNPQTGSRPLLYYYAFLNLAKTFLISRGVDLPPLVRHGISDPKANLRTRLRLEGQKVQVYSTARDRSQLFPEFLKVLGWSGRGPFQVKVLDLLAQVPAVHRTYFRVTGETRRFLPVERWDLLSDGRHVWARCYAIGNDQDVRETLGRVGKRRAFRRLFTRIQAEKTHEVGWETTAARGRKRGVDKAVSQLAGQIRGVGIWAVLRSTGYRYYFGTFLRSHRIPQLASIYAIMFYLGSITRYKPYDFDRIVEGRYAWLVNEFLATQPQQFLYLLASTMVGSDVVRSWAVT